jgi:hypothetical protein
MRKTCRWVRRGRTRFCLTQTRFYIWVPGCLQAILATFTIVMSWSPMFSGKAQHLFRVGMPSEYGKSAINLFGEHDARQFVRKREGGKR